MTRPRRVLPKLFALLLVIVAAAAATPLFSLPLLRSASETRLSRMLGRKVTIDSAKLNLLGGPYLTLTGLTVEEASEFGENNFLKADEARADFGLLEFLRTRQLVIEGLTLKSPKIELVRNTDGVWNWTSIGSLPSEKPVSTASLILTLLMVGELPKSALERIKIENADVEVVDRSRAQPQGVHYKQIGLEARLTPAGTGRRAQGDLVVQSAEDGEADLLKGTLPFDVEINTSASALSVKGAIGPGPIETKNLSIGKLAINGQIVAQRAEPLTGSGRISASDMFIRTINLSERVARALKVNQIGDMSSGTRVTSFETDYQLSRGTVNTTNLRIQQLDGIGDATAPSGSFTIESDLIVNYAATITLSAESTTSLKSASSMLGLLVTILETNNQLSVPISFSGDLRQPEIQVDVNRIF